MSAVTERNAINNLNVCNGFTGVDTNRASDCRGTDSKCLNYDRILGDSRFMTTVTAQKQLGDALTREQWRPKADR